MRRTVLALVAVGLTIGGLTVGGLTAVQPGVGADPVSSAVGLRVTSN